MLEEYKTEARPDSFCSFPTPDTDHIPPLQTLAHSASLNIFLYRHSFTSTDLSLVDSFQVPFTMKLFNLLLLAAISSGVIAQRTNFCSSNAECSNRVSGFCSLRTNQ